MPTASYGSWPSPVTTEVLTSSLVGLSAATLDGADLYWVESRADQAGRGSLWRRSAAGAVEELTPAPFSVRTQVHEYGGGEYAVRDRVVVFSSLADGRVYRLAAGAAPTPITPHGDRRYADLRVHPRQNLVLAVREDHSGPGEPVHTLVALDLDGHNADGGRVLCAGADFYATPELSPNGRLAWTQWQHPMPWDAATVMAGSLTDAGVVDAVAVANGRHESAVQPRWTPSGALIFVSDRTGWWNLYRWDGTDTTALLPREAEFAEPGWVFGQHPYAVLDADRLLCTWTEAGATAMGVLDQSSGELSLVAPGDVGTASVTVSGRQAAAVRQARTGLPRVAVLDLASGEWTEVRAAGAPPLVAEAVSIAEAVTWDGEQGPVHGWFYPPTNPGYAAPEGERPPLLTLSHGGPTGMARPYFSLGVQYWTSRGVAVLDVNYGGSSGYGRAYRERLRHRWGIVDVADCAAGAVAMAEQGRADRDRLAVLGGSAGGYTTLRALTTTDVFRAGISLYGVADLERLALDTHKFESRYLDGLIGPYPAAAEVYRDRSPISHLDRLNAPILLLQGADDKVVPPNQAEAMAAAARARGLPVALIVFPGEGHGFRRAETIRASLQAQLAFLGRIFGFTPADDLPPLAIENLP